MNDIEKCLAKNYTYIRSRETAEAFLDKHGWMTFPNTPVINIEIVALKAGTIINYIDGLQSLGTYGTGFKNLKENRLEIVIDSTHYSKHSHSSQFTIAEEVAHILIHSPMFETFQSVKDRIAYENSLDDETHQYFEMQAKRVASELLLPFKTFNPFVMEWCRDNFESLQKENPNDEDDLVSLISERLSKKFGLSDFIITKAMKRYNPNRLIDEVMTQLGFRLLKNTVANRISISEEAKLKAKKRLQ